MVDLNFLILFFCILFKQIISSTLDSIICSYIFIKTFDIRKYRNYTLYFIFNKKKPRIFEPEIIKENFFYLRFAPCVGIFGFALSKFYFIYAFKDNWEVGKCNWNKYKTELTYRINVGQIVQEVPFTKEHRHLATAKSSLSNVIYISLIYVS